MTLLSIDPGTHSLGWALWKDGALENADFVVMQFDLPSAVLRHITEFIGNLHEQDPIDAIVIESMFMDPKRGGNTARLLNVIPDEVREWAKEHDVAFEKLGNSTVKKQVAGRGNAEKPLVYSYVKHLWPAMEEMPRDNRLDVSDAIAIGVAAMKLDTFKDLTTTVPTP